MRSFTLTTVAALLSASLVNSQAFAYINTSYPATCAPGYSAQLMQDVSTIAYDFATVLPLVASWPNISGIPITNLSITPANGSPINPGTTRSFLWAGLVNITDTLVYYSYPSIAPAGQSQPPYQEVHSTAPFVMSANFSTRDLYSVPYPYPTTSTAMYFAYYSLTAASVCGGLATRLNFTSVFCTNDTRIGATASSTFAAGLNSYASSLASGGTFPGLGQFAPNEPPVRQYYSCAKLVGAMGDNDAFCVNDAYNGTTGALIVGQDLVPAAGAFDIGAMGSSSASASESSAMGSTVSGTSTAGSTSTAVGTTAASGSTATSATIGTAGPSTGPSSTGATSSSAPAGGTAGASATSSLSSSSGASAATTAVSGSAGSSTKTAAPSIYTGAAARLPRAGGWIELAVLVGVLFVF